MLLRVLGLASGVCLALGPEIPEVAHRGPSLDWSGGHIPIRGAPYVCILVYVCTILSRATPIPEQGPTPNFDSSVVYEVVRVIAHHAKFLHGHSKVHSLSSRRLFR